MGHRETFKIIYVLIFVLLFTPMVQAQQTVSNDIFFPIVISMLNNGKTVIFTSKGKSMRPFIEDGDIILLEKSASYEKGDIVLAHLPTSQFVLHRIISISHSIVTLMGDGNTFGQEHCPLDSLKAICRAKLTPNKDTISLVSNSQKARAELWGSVVFQRDQLLPIFYDSNENEFWDNVFTQYILSKNGILAVRPCYELLDMGDDGILLIKDSSNIDFTQAITLNNSAKFLFGKVYHQTFNIHTLVYELMLEYDVTEQTATNDCIQLLTSWFRLGIIKINY